MQKKVSRLINKSNKIVTSWTISKLTWPVAPYTRNLRQQQSRAKAAVADSTTALPNQMFKNWVVIDQQLFLVGS